MRPDNSAESPIPTSRRKPIRRILGFLLVVAVTAAAASTAAAAVVDATAAQLNHPAATAPARTLELQGAPNFRDIGGYALDDGRHVRWGRVFRSSALSKLTPDDVAKVDRLDLAAVVDLRTLEEREKSPSVWARRPRDIYESPKESLAPVMQTIMHDAQTADGARAGIESFYARMPDSYRTEYAALFHRIAAGKLPILVHCSAGKDRTGVAIAVLLASIGVPRDTIIGDYALTEKLVPELPTAQQSAATVGAAAQASAVLAQLPDESRHALWRSDPEYISVALHSIDREYGSVDSYVRHGLRISDREIAVIRKALTE
jgi:protein-tyrosine phosphatase